MGAARREVPSNLVRQAGAIVYDDLNGQPVLTFRCDNKTGAELVSRSLHGDVFADDVDAPRLKQETGPHE